MTSPDPAAQFAQFQAWLASQQGQTTQPAVPAEEKPSIADVLHSLVNLVPVASEAAARTYHQAIDEWHAVQEKIQESVKSE